MATSASTAGDIITRVRHLTGDVRANAYKNVDTAMLLYVTDGEREILARRPELYLDADGAQHTGVSVPLPAAKAATATSLNLNPSYDNALVSYVCYRALSALKGATLEEDQVNGAAAARHYETFLALVRQ